MRRAEGRIRDMLLAIEGIEHHTSEGKERFARDDVLHGYVAYRLMVRGEAADRMPHSPRRQYGGIPWRQIGGLRHVLVHGYCSVDLGIVRGVVERDLPGLREQLERVLHDMSE